MGLLTLCLDDDVSILALRGRQSGEVHVILDMPNETHGLS
jgi:hypothetical protein